MAIEFNIDGTATKQFFLGEDKTIDLEIFDADGVTPLNVVSFTLEWTLRKQDKSPDPALLRKRTAVNEGITIVGTFVASGGVNSQRVRLAFPSDQTDPLVTSVLAAPTAQQPTAPYTLKPNINYRHSLKRTDAGYEGILSYGNFMFLQVTER